MSSVSLIGNSFQACSSPRDLLQKELSSEVAAGTINSADQTALSDALDNIDAALKAERGSGQSRPPSPEAMKSKIDDLIAGEVEDGTLTAEQADELKNVFANAFSAAGRPGGPGGPGGPSGPRGPGGPPPADSADDSASSLSATDSTSTDSTVEELLAQFLKSLQETLSQSSGYGSDGQTRSFTAALMVDYQA